MNISDIARKAQVSTATVSRVLNHSSLVTPKTRERVERVIREQGYTPSAVAKSLSVRATHNMGVIFPDIENPFFSSALIGITQVAEQKKYNVFYFNSDETPEKEHEFLAVIRQQRLDGIILSPADGYDQVTGSILEEFEQKNVAVVLLDRDLDRRQFSMVRAKDQEGAYLAVRQLIREGHTRIAIIMGSPSNRPVFERCAGYLQAMEEAGVPVRPEYMVRADQKSEIAFTATRTLMELPEPPTAIFTCNNMMTLGCLRFCTEHGIHIGRDIALIGFDDIQTLRDVGYHLSVVDRSSREMGRIAMELLMKRLEDPSSPKETRFVPTELILRGSEKLSD